MYAIRSYYDEQQQHHAEFAEVEDGLHVMDRPQAPGPEQDAGRQIAEDGPQPGPLGQRHEDNGTEQKEGDLAQP